MKQMNDYLTILMPLMLSVAVATLLDLEVMTCIQNACVFQDNFYGGIVLLAIMTSYNFVMS